MAPAPATSKGEATRQSILQHAAGLASQVGLEGITIGRLAEDLRLSKSGLFAHFQSKEALQLAILEHASALFVEKVVRPALQAARGEPRIRAAFEHWLAWPRRSGLPGGCFFVSAAFELDDRTGPVRDRLVQLQKDWLDTIATMVRAAVAEGHFRGDVEPEQFAHDLYSVMLGGLHAARLLGDPHAGRRMRQAFESLVAAARPPVT
jgi:AcrR family transcriptional regulator